MQAPRGHVLYHRCNAVLTRVMRRSRAEMILSELNATIGWLERNCLTDHTVAT